MKRMIFVCSLFLLCVFSGNVFAQNVCKPFNGKNLEGWKAVNEKAANFWKAGNAILLQDNEKALRYLSLNANESGVLVNMSGPDWGKEASQRGVDLYTEQKFGDCTLEIEFMVPKGSNSGVYLMGEYEVQVLDSWGKPDDKLSQGDVGAIYSADAPKLNASLEPGKWQKFVIEFVAPRFDADGNKIKNALFTKITLNGKVIQENVEVTKGSTGGGITGKESPTGPLMLQGNHGPVAYRNIVITEKK